MLVFVACWFLRRSSCARLLTECSSYCRLYFLVSKGKYSKHKMIYCLTLIIFWKHTVAFYYKSILMNHNRLFCLIYKKVPFWFLYISEELLFLLYVRFPLIVCLFQILISRPPFHLDSRFLNRIRFLGRHFVALFLFFCKRGGAVRLPKVRVCRVPVSGV